MYDIIKKALDEALSEQYAAQLMSAADEGYSFSPVFEKKMKTLVRKTDRPYVKYMQYLGVAACAAVAVGCGILMPKLIQQNVPVETTTSEVISAAPAEEKPPITTTDNNDAVLPTISYTTSAAAEPTESETAAETTSVPNNPESVTSYNEDENPNAIGISSATSEPGITEPNDDVFPGRGDGTPIDITEDEIADKDDVTDDSGNDTYYEAEDTDSNDDNYDFIDDNDDAADDVVVDAEDDFDDDVDDEDSDYVDDEDDGDSVIIRPAIPKENTLGDQINSLIGCRLSESYPYSVILYQNGDNYYDFSSGLTIPETAERFRDKAIAETLEKAELITDSFELSDKYIKVDISDISPTLWNSAFTYTRSAFDSSPRNNYNTLFLGEADEDEADEEDYIEADVEYRSCTILIYDNGIIAANSYKYSGTMYFRTDSKTADEIFTRAERNILPDNITDTAALLEAVASSETDIKKTYLCTMGTVYDIRMGAPCDGKYLYELLKNNASGAIIPTGSVQRSDSLLSFSFVSAKTAQSYSVFLYSDSKAELYTQQNHGYLFSLPLEKTLDTLDYLCGLNGKPAAKRYANLEEYLEGKNFTGFSYLGTTDYSTVETEEGTNTVVTDIAVYGIDSKVSKKVTELILKYASKSEYVPSGIKSENERHIMAKVPNWTAFVSFYGDSIVICSNTFKLPDGLNEKIFKAMYAGSSLTVKTYPKRNDLLYYNLNNGKNIYEEASSDILIKTLDDDICSWLGAEISECTIDEVNYHNSETDTVRKIYPNSDFSEEYITDNLLNVISDAEYECVGALENIDIFLTLSYKGKRCRIWLNADGNIAAEINNDEQVYTMGKKNAESIKAFLKNIRIS